MADLSLPDVELLVYPISKIPKKKYPGFIIGDVLGNLMNLGMGDSAGLGIEGMNPTVSLDWMTGTGSNDGIFVLIQNLEFVRFLKDGQFREGASTDNLNALAPDKNSEVSGFILEGREGFLDCKIGTTALNTSYFDSNWKVLQGEWETIQPPDAPARTRIANTGTSLTSKACTIGDIDANRSLRFDLNFSGSISPSTQPACRISWGNDTYSVVGRHGMKWTVEKFINGQWQVLRKLDGAPPCNMNHQRYTVRVRRIAGRLVVSINDHAFHFLEMRQTASGRAVPVDAAWPKGKLAVNFFNVRASLGCALIKYATASDVPFEGFYTRQVPCRTAIMQSEQNNPPIGKTSGWQSNGTLTEISNVAVGGGYALYTCALTANSAGIDTPFVSKAMIQFAQQWTAPTAAAIDLRPFLKRITVDCAMPPIVAGSELTVEVDRAYLDKKIAGWDNTITRYSPVELRVRRRYSDGSTEDWVKLFKGYIWNDPKASDGVGARGMTLTCRDSIIRLQKPAAIIDHHYPPLDFLFAFQEIGTRPLGEIWGSDCIKEILRRTVGDDEADALNGNGDGERYFTDHYPLIDFSGDSGGYFGTVAGITGQPPTQNGFLFPPPFGEDAINWIDKIRAYDHAVFFYGWPSGYSGDWPAPVYGRILNIIAGRATITIPDKEYLSGDRHKVMLSAETEGRPDKDFNRFLVWANPGGAAAPDFIPAIRMAEARLPTDDRNAAELTWERTDVIKEDIAAPAGAAEGLAMGRMLLQRDVETIWPKSTLRFLPTLDWGYKVQFAMDGATSDVTIGLNGKTFRVEKVQHTIEFGSNDANPAKTNIWTRPLSGTGF